MTVPNLRELVADLRLGADAVGRLAEDDTVFRAAVDAFRAEDGESFNLLLGPRQIGEHCGRICRWLCSKECVRICLLLCGPPTQPISLDEIPRFAEVVAKIAGDEELVERLADAVNEEDREGFQSLVAELEITSFAHLLCHWACMIRCRLRCEVVCSATPVPTRHFVSALGVAGGAIGELARDGGALAEVVKGGATANCETVSAVIGAKGNCFSICEWICSWRCVLVCLRLCRDLPMVEDTSIEEMRVFAQVSARLAATEGALGRLAAAVEGQNADAFAGLVEEFQLERYCMQLCHWICAELCRLFCICVCPQSPTIPLFTHVGVYRVKPASGDFTVDGTTTAGDLAFTLTVPLIGVLPDGGAPDPLEYRFTTEKYPLGAAPQDVTAAMIAPSVIGQLEYWEFDSATSSWGVTSGNYYVNNAGAPDSVITINQPVGSLTVPVNKDVKPGGWIEVPTENDLTHGGIGRFVPQGGLVNLDTTKLTDEHVDLTPAAPPLPVRAGDPVPPAQKSDKPVFRINFETRKVGTVALLNTNSRDKIALSNTHYTYTRHPEWAGGNVTEIPVLSVDVVELAVGGGCIPLEEHVHASFTAYHPYLGTCSVYIEGPGIPPPPAVSPVISADGEATSPPGGHDFDITMLAPCAYIVWLSGTLRLTVGYGAHYSTFYDHIAFCKH